MQRLVPSSQDHLDVFFSHILDLYHGSSLDSIRTDIKLPKRIRGHVWSKYRKKYATHEDQPAK